MSEDIFFNKLQPTVIQSWADMQEEEEQQEQEKLSLQDFCVCLHDLVERVEIDEHDKTAYHFKVQDTYIDLMYRNHMVISIAKEKKNHRLADKDSDSDSDHDEDTSTEEEYSSDSLDEENTTTEGEDNENQNDDQEGWQTVETKTKRNRKKKNQPRFIQNMNQSTMSFQVFSDAAKDPEGMNYLREVKGVKALMQIAKHHKWCHGYCPEEQVIYDFHKPDDPYFFIKRDVDEKYMTKYNDHMNQSNKTEDKTVFYLFRESPTWKEKPYVGQCVGLASLRQKVKDLNTMWSHAFDPESKLLYSFLIKDGKFSQRCKLAQESYIEWFHEFQQQQQQQQQKT